MAKPPPDIVIEEPPVAEQQGVFVVIERTDDGAGITRVTPIPVGDVRPAEVLTILASATKVVRANLEL